jgi:hypothetical protein
MKLATTLALAILLAAPGCKKNKKGDKETKFEDSQECKDFIAAVDKDCKAPSEANEGVCRSMKGTVEAMQKTLDFAKGKLTAELKKTRTEQCVKTHDALKASLQP